MKNIIILICCALWLTACGSSTNVGNGAYTVSGTVTSGGSALSGVTVTFTGTSSGSATTASDGSYSFTGVNNGVYQITATKTGYVVAPASISVTVTNAHVTGQNFTATAASYNVTGSVKEGGTGLADVTVTLTGTTITGSNTTVTGTTDVNGSYTIGVIDGTYSLSASKTGYTFSPSSISLTLANTDQAVQDITATPVSYTLSGSITHGGSALSGATVTLSGGTTGTTTTDASGNYSFSVTNGSYTITPSLTSYTFSPASASVTINNADSTGNDFTSTTTSQTQLLTNNSFESGLSGWTVDQNLQSGAAGTCGYNGVTAPGIETLSGSAGFPATDGTQLALGYVADTANNGAIITCALYQDVAIPAGTTDLTFTFNVGLTNIQSGSTHAAARVGIYSTSGIPYFNAQTLVGTSVLYSKTSADTNLQSQTSTVKFNATTVAGTTVRFAILNAANSSGHEVIGIDNLKLTATVVQ